jgi:hypothetical protein
VVEPRTLLGEFANVLHALTSVLLPPAQSQVWTQASAEHDVVATVVVPHPEYVAFAAHFGFVPDFCETAIPNRRAWWSVWLATPSAI